ncbi:cytochrome C [Methylophaga sp. SB9B]|nr:cytochrome C [Methylophaga sp. SB9B]
MHVPGVASSGLNSTEIAEVMNYIVELWGDKTADYTPFTKEEVNQLRAIDIADVVSYRREIAEQYKKEGKEVADYPWP